jgi:hypothetical protein
VCIYSQLLLISEKCARYTTNQDMTMNDFQMQPYFEHSYNANMEEKKKAHTYTVLSGEKDSTIMLFLTHNPGIISPI